MSESKTPRTDAKWEELKILAGNFCGYINAHDAQIFSELMRTVRNYCNELEIELSAALRALRRANSFIEDWKERAEKAEAGLIWIFDLDGPPKYVQGNELLHETMNLVTADKVQQMSAELSRYREAEKALPEEPLEHRIYRPSEYAEKLRAHAAAIQAERDALKYDIARQVQTCTELATENEALREDAERMRDGLRYYAHGEHWITEGGSRDKWDTCPGESGAWWWRENEDESAEAVEDGSVARMTLAGETIDWEDEKPKEHPCEPAIKPIAARKETP